MPRERFSVEMENQATAAKEQPNKMPVRSSPEKQDIGPVAFPRGEAATSYFPASPAMGPPIASRTLGWDPIDQGGPEFP